MSRSSLSPNRPSSPEPYYERKRERERERKSDLRVDPRERDPRKRGHRRSRDHDREVDIEPEAGPEPEPEPEPDLQLAPGGAGRRGVLRPDDGLTANEVVWQDYLRQFQQRREKEAHQMISWTPALGVASRKMPIKRKGWPSNHPTRIAQRQAKEAALAAGIEIPKKKYKRKSKASMLAGGIDDELLGLAEGEGKGSSPMPASSVIDGEEGEPVNLDPSSIVYPCGLTRAEVMNKVESGNIRGLTEDDVKQVQDEMWLRKSGAQQLRKDGTMRKKPGPAKGWKAMRRLQERVGGDDSDADSLADRSMAMSVGGDPDADIAALLEEEPPKPKKRRKKTHTSHIDAADEAIISELEEMSSMHGDDGESGLENGDGSAPAPKRRSAKIKEPGVGKGRWTRPVKGPGSRRGGAGAGDMDDELAHAAGFDGTGSGASSAAPPPRPPRQDYVPNTHDPRGVSEAEAQVRLSLVEELQRQIWTSITRDIPKMYRVMQAHDAAKAQDCARTAQAAVRNAFSQRNLKPTYRSSTKANKEAVAKGKKVMREMLVYWKKNEKEELAARKRAEKEALEKAKAEEEAREAKRQSRKLNFLLTQTELYSHFIGKKIKTTDAENMDGDTVRPAAPAPQGAEHEDGDDAEPLKDLDYDEDDDENLRRHAARSAQAAIQANKDRAAQFDAAKQQQNGGAAELDDDTMDGDELNFQNPSLGTNSVTITQPKMLMAQLKEYQLKGLTWLGNLYEQGINGILADEMGLGKTIQSISLLAYLAESHNLWGPFLVIAPASTLHNWQQELARFVPRLKALPYWGSPKDRETLRRIWSKKNQTFTEDSPFHILVTSYQLAVQDEKYFHGMKWQYMVLDEAQAIKSSSSARWKSLLSIDCRNRLLLTGTPIQNSMHGKCSQVTMSVTVC
jgi:DNA helicase INO80